jgi:hypothetical protein
LFLEPSEVIDHCAAAGLVTSEVRGSAPVIFSHAFWRLLRTGVVPEDFRFQFVRSTLLGYTGYALADP